VEPGDPFGTIEGAYEYVRMLGESIAETQQSVRGDIDAARTEGATRRVDALALVAFKLDKLRGHVENSRRILNDLRSLRRLLLSERGEDLTAERARDEPDEG
jgi:hypothetical protein